MRDIILLIVCTLLALGSGFVLGRKHPLPDFDAEYEDMHQFDADQFDVDERVDEPVPAFSSPSPATGTYEYLYQDSAMTPRERRDGDAGAQHTAVLHNDVAEAAAFFESLNEESDCTACSSTTGGGGGNCFCVEDCGRMACTGWAKTSSITPAAPAPVNDDAWKTDVLCNQMDRETADYMLKMETSTRTFLAGIKAEGARHEYMAVVVEHDVASEVGPITQPIPIAAISAGR